MSKKGKTTTTKGHFPNGTATLELHLTISANKNPDLYTELSKREEPERSEFTIAIMETGVKVLRYGEWQIGAELTRQVFEEYFDPNKGHFNQQVQSLTGKNGNPGKMDESVQRAVNNAMDKPTTKFMDALTSHEKADADRHNAMLERMAAGTAKKQEREKSTWRGLDFQEAVFQFIDGECRKAGDLAENTAYTQGLIRDNRKGDVVVELGRDSAAAGAKIVIEAKDDGSYTLKKALGELEEAKKNRGADIGVFVFSKRTVPEELDTFMRYGGDVVVVWDTEDAGSNVVLRAGFSAAKALSVRTKVYSEEVGADFGAIKGAIDEIEALASGLKQIETWVKTINNNSEKVLKEVDKMRDRMNAQIVVLDEKVAGLRKAVGSDS